MLQAQIFIDKDDLKGLKPLYEYILEFLVEHDITGATVFRGQIGFGANQKIKRPDTIFSFDEPPMMIVVIDQEEKILNALTELRQEVKNGLITIQPIEIFEP